jgi:hypothetical protein
MLREEIHDSDDADGSSHINCMPTMPDLSDAQCSLLHDRTPQSANLDAAQNKTARPRVKVGRVYR